MRSTFQRSVRRKRLSIASIASIVFVAVAGTTAPSAVAQDGVEDSAPATEVIVSINPNQTSIEAVTAASGTTVIDQQTGLGSVYLLQIPVGADVSVVADAIDAMPGVLFAESNDETGAAEVGGQRVYRWAGSDPIEAGQQYATTALELDAVHALNTGSGVTVAVIDTGVQLLPAPHPDLAAAIGVGADFVDGDAVPDDEANGLDDDGDDLIDEGAGHGTHIAGVIHQVAPDATILPVRVLDSDGNGNEWAVIQGMFWAANNGATVVNLSAGRRNSGSALIKAVDALTELGVVSVIAAGNDGRGGSNRPARATCALAVAGTTAADAVAAFSTRGSWVDVGAPGEGITSTFPFFATGYASWDGTSMAAPYVAGQVALLQSMNPALRVGDVLAYVKGTTVGYSGLALRPKAGFGRISPLASLTALQNAARPSLVTYKVSKKCF